MNSSEIKNSTLYELVSEYIYPDSDVDLKIIQHAINRLRGALDEAIAIRDILKEQK